MSNPHLKPESFRLLQETLNRRFGASSGLSAVQSSALYSSPKRPCDVESVRWEVAAYSVGRYNSQNLQKITYEESKSDARVLSPTNQITCLSGETIQTVVRVSHLESCDIQLHPLLSVQTPDTLAVYAGPQTHQLNLDLNAPANIHTSSETLSSVNKWINKPDEGVFACKVTDTPLRTASPRQYKLAAESCGLRLQGNANKWISTSTHVYNGDQHRIHWGPVKHRLTEKDEKIPEAQGLSLEYFCNGNEERGFDGFRQGFKDFSQLFAEQIRKWLRQLALNSQLTQVQYRSDLQLWEGENHLLWGFTESETGQVDLGASFNFKGNAFQWNLQCSGMLNHPFAKGRLNFTLSGDLPVDIASNNSVGFKLNDLFSPCTWPIEVHAKVEFDPNFEDVRLIQNMRVGPEPVGFGLLSIKPQPDNAGLEWGFHLDFKDFNVILSECVLGGTQSERVLTLCPSSTLINWRMG